jgi:DNA-binding LytR/AlgR family response regulator
MQLAMREWRHLGRWRGLASAVAIGLLLGVMGPFGSQTAYPTATKYAFWMVNALAGFGSALAADRILPSASPGAKSWPRIAALAAASAVPMTFFVAWTMSVVQPGRAFSPLQLLALFPFVALVQLLIARVLSPAHPPAAAETAEPTEDTPRYPVEFLSKLPPAQRRDIIALEAEDHYLRVHTLNGSALVLMRLADAAAAIDPRLGLRVHRSWWVARDGVDALESSSGRPTVRLVDGTRVPVSRTYLPEARSVLSE